MEMGWKTTDWVTGSSRRQDVSELSVTMQCRRKVERIKLKGSPARVVVVIEAGCRCANAFVEPSLLGLVAVSKLSVAGSIRSRNAPRG
jgi:hypothetical protein